MSPSAILARPLLAWLAVSGLAVTGCHAPFDHTESHLVTDPVHTLVVDTDAGNVEVIGCNAPNVSIDAAFYGEDLVLERVLEGQSLALRSQDDEKCWGCRIDLIVRVPARVKVDVDTGSGDVGIRNIAGECRAETGSGDITVETFGGQTLTLDTGSGDIDAHHIWAAEVFADTGSGDVNLSFEAPPYQVYTDTGSGDQDLLLPYAAYALNADTGSGDVSVTGIQVDDASSRALSLGSGSGDIRVEGFLTE